MNNQTAIFRLCKLEKEISDLKEKVESTNSLVKDLIRLLAPSFSRVDENSANNELAEASTQAREDGIANSLNPNLLGVRDIPKTLKEVTEAFRPTKTQLFPGPQLRLLGLINHLKKEKGITGLDIRDKSNLGDYKILKTVTRKVHDNMVDEIYKELRKEGKPVVLPLWSQVSPEITSKYGYILEKTASNHGFPLSRCKQSWAALLFLFETHKHRSNRSRIEAAVYDDSFDFAYNSSYGEIVNHIEAIQEGRPSQDYVDLNFGDDFEEFNEDYSLSSSPLLSPLIPSFSPSITSSSSSPGVLFTQKRVVARENELETVHSCPPKSRAKKTRQSKRQ